MATVGGIMLPPPPASYNPAPGGGGWGTATLLDSGWGSATLPAGIALPPPPNASYLGQATTIPAPPIVPNASLMGGGGTAPSPPVPGGLGLPPGLWEAAQAQIAMLGPSVTTLRDAWARMMAGLQVTGNVPFQGFWARVWDLAGGQVTNNMAVAESYRRAFEEFAYPAGRQSTVQDPWALVAQNPQAPATQNGMYYDPVTGQTANYRMFTDYWSPPPTLFGSAPSTMTGWYYDWQNQNWTTNDPGQFNILPYPWQISPLVWNSLGPTGQALLKGAAEASGWDWAEYVARMQAAWPAGTAPSQTLTTYQDLRRY